MWYTNGKQIHIDFKRPIICENKETGHKWLLLPQINAKTSYLCVGYNWFNLREGVYDSCCFFDTPQEAIESRKNYKVYNATIEPKEAFF